MDDPCIIPRCGFRIFLRISVTVFLVWSVAAILCSGHAADRTPTAWPAESRDEAEPLFVAGAKSVAGQNNWSGAHWNPDAETLWLCRNNHEFRAYRRNGTTWSLSHGPFAILADFEAITQIDFSRDVVLLLAENDQEIHEYAVAGQDAELLRKWDIADVIEDKKGFEGMVFIPDGFLSDGFVDGRGKPYPKSKFDFGGIVLISYQETGDIYALDLKEDGTVHHIGVYATPLTETRGLEFDRSTGRLHAVDRFGYAQMTLASSSDGNDRRRFTVLKHTLSPGPAGLEGIALPPADTNENWVILTDDDNDGDRAILRYNTFDPSD